MLGPARRTKLAAHAFVWAAVALALMPSAARAGDPTAVGEERARPRNVILMIGDGMGLAQLRAASLHAHGRGGALVMEGLPHTASVTTSSPTAVGSGTSEVTDSAAAGTAIATGHKVRNGVLGLAIPGGGGRLTNMVEHFRAEGLATGIVTTAAIVDATPAAFTVHVDYRREYDAIARMLFGEARPDVVLGGAVVWDTGEGPFPERAAAWARDSGYAVVRTRAALESLKPGEAERVLGLFGDGPMPYEQDAVRYAALLGDPYGKLPHLSEMTAAALRLLSANPRGFFVMVEGARIDGACHAHSLPRAVAETLEFDRAVKVALDWARGRREPPAAGPRRARPSRAAGRDGDTLIVVTADHETGGLEVVRGAGKGELPEVRWTASGHTASPVPLFAWGVGAERFEGTLVNTELFTLVTCRKPYEPAAGAGKRKPGEPSAATAEPASERDAVPAAP